jgi:hypothetical protein
VSAGTWWTCHWTSLAHLYQVWSVLNSLQGQDSAVAGMRHCRSEAVPHSSEAVPHLEFNFYSSLFLNRPIHPPLGDIKVLSVWLSCGLWKSSCGKSRRLFGWTTVAFAKAVVSRPTCHTWPTCHSLLSSLSSPACSRSPGWGRWCRPPSHHAAR